MRENSDTGAERWLEVHHTLCLTLRLYQILIALEASAESEGSANKEFHLLSRETLLDKHFPLSVIFPPSITKQSHRSHEKNRQDKQIITRFPLNFRINAESARNNLFKMVFVNSLTTQLRLKILFGAFVMK